jgi:hypothetical protein
MDPTRLPHAPYPIAPGSQTACYSSWLKVRVLIRAALTMPWSHPKTGLRYASTSSGSWPRRVGCDGEGSSTDSPRCSAARSPACRHGGLGR